MSEMNRVALTSLHRRTVIRIINIVEHEVQTLV